MILDEEDMREIILDRRPAGYQFVMQALEIEGLPNWHLSFVASGNTSQRIEDNNQIIEVFRSQYWPGETLCDHLEFALKYDGANPSKCGPKD